MCKGTDFWDCVQDATADTLTWQVENNLHWQLDVNFMEDAGRKKNNEALNFSTICKIALAALNNMEDKRPINRKMKVAGWNDDYLLRLLGML